MLRQKKHRRALWPAPFAAAPIAAHAGAVAPKGLLQYAGSYVPHIAGVISR